MRRVAVGLFVCMIGVWVLVYPGCGFDVFRRGEKPAEDTRASAVSDPPGQTNALIEEPTIQCPDRSELRHPYFGDLHVHTSYSFDSYTIQNTRNDPVTAYRFARGARVPVPPFDSDDKASRTQQLRTPLDFTAVTDHSEFLGEVSICTDPEMPGYQLPPCAAFRRLGLFEEKVLGGDLSFLLWGVRLTIANPTHVQICGRLGINCPDAAKDAWERIKDAADQANDPCSFTALQGYEWTGTNKGAMNHRNVIFRSSQTPSMPITFIDVQNWHDLALGLKAQCIDAGTGCDVLTIPHNPNYSRGTLFAPQDREGKAYTREVATLRAEMEPLVEIIQVKQESECRNGFERYPAAADEYCNFEKMDPLLPICEPGEKPCGLLQSEARSGCRRCLPECGKGQTDGCIAAIDYVRNVLKLGLEEERRIGVNPYPLGFIGSTDTHNGTPGATHEPDHVGSHGIVDGDMVKVLSGGSMSHFTSQATPGGLAVVWAEQNSRDRVFDALRRRETYATSGSRPIVRTFAGWDLPEKMCGSFDFAKDGYGHGVPMGGVLEAFPGGPAAPTLAVKAARDPASAQLQQIQVIKVWLDRDGVPREKVFDITPNPDYSATVDLQTCDTRGPGRDEICATWRDPDFDPAESAAYYVRVLENPTCRWSTYQCNLLNVSCDDPDAPQDCCNGEVPKTIQERAWTSPIWYRPASLGQMAG